MINTKKHDAIHRVFPNMLPQEQLMELLKIHEQVFNREVVEFIRNSVQMILDEPAQYVFKKGLYRPKH